MEMANFAQSVMAPMDETRPFHAIPRLRRDRGVDVNASLAVVDFVYMKCRYLEFYSAER